MRTVAKMMDRVSEGRRHERDDPLGGSSELGFGAGFLHGGEERVRWRGARFPRGEIGNSGWMDGIE